MNYKKCYYCNAEESTGIILSIMQVDKVLHNVCGMCLHTKRYLSNPKVEEKKSIKS